MDDNKDNNNNTKQQESSEAVLIFTFLLLITLVCAYYLHLYHIRVLHESLIATTLGIFTGLIVHFTGGSSIQELITFDYRYFFNLLLPPIILKSGFDLDVRHFFGNLGSILTFAFIGTVISAIVIGLLLYLLIITKIGGISMTFIQCLMFGSILSSTDPGIFERLEVVELIKVTILAIFSQIKVDPTLYALVFGESMLNDAVSIVLYDVLNDLQKSPMNGNVFIAGFAKFMGVFVGSTCVGVGVALVLALILKYTDLYKYPAMETSVLILIAYSAYLLSNLAGLTGIVSLLFCAIAMKHYVFPNLSQISQQTTLDIFRAFAHLVENFIFIYLGVSIFTQPDSAFKFSLTFFTFIFILFGRACAVFPLAMLLNFLSKSRTFAFQFRNRTRVFSTSGIENGVYLPRNHIIMLWWAGLRGAIAFALSMSINAPSLSEVKTTTLIVVILSIFVLGGTTTEALKRLQIELPPVSPERVSGEATDGESSHGTEEEFLAFNLAEQRTASKYAKHWFVSFDQKYLIPLFTRQRGRYRPLASPPGDFALERINEEENGIVVGNYNNNPFVLEDETVVIAPQRASFPFNDPSAVDLSNMGAKTVEWTLQPSWDQESSLEPLPVDKMSPTE